MVGVTSAAELDEIILARSYTKSVLPEFDFIPKAELIDPALGACYENWRYSAGQNWFKEIAQKGFGAIRRNSRDRPGVKTSTAL